MPHKKHVVLALFYNGCWAIFVDFSTCKNGEKLENHVCDGLMAPPPTGTWSNGQLHSTPILMCAPIK
jgi:hypothetical protein